MHLFLIRMRFQIHFFPRANGKEIENPTTGNTRDRSVSNQHDGTYYRSGTVEWMKKSRENRAEFEIFEKQNQGCGIG